jgi:hypothetical protein
MDDLIAAPEEQSDSVLFQPQVFYQNREIKKWQAIARMVDPNPDVLPFALTTTDPERRWAFFSQASGILHQSEARAVEEVTDNTSGAVVEIF